MILKNYISTLLLVVELCWFCNCTGHLDTMVGHRKGVKIKDKLLKVFGMNERRVGAGTDDGESVAMSIAEARHSETNISDAQTPMIKADKGLGGRR